MKKLSVQKLSLLGLVLMGASAVTAAVLPSNTKDASNLVVNGSLTNSDDNGINGSCVVTGNITNACNDTDSTGSDRLSASTVVGGSEGFTE
jgi:hypothetical protein